MDFFRFFQFFSWIFFQFFVKFFWQNFCKNFGRWGSRLPRKHKSTMHFLYKSTILGVGVHIFPYRTKVPSILLYSKGWVGPEGTRNTKVCTNVHTCMYICTLAPSRNKLQCNAGAANSVKRLQN